MKLLRVLALGLLPLIALALGFQLGMSYEDRMLSIDRQRLEDLFTQSGSGTVVQGDPEDQVDISLLWGVWRLLQKHYLQPETMTSDAMVYGAVSGLVDALDDPYTLFMTPKDTKDFDNAMSGTLEGIGAQLDSQSGIITIVSPLKGSPAERAGLLARDVIIKVDDVDITNLRLDEVVGKIRGPKGTAVSITVVRQKENEPLTVSVIRDAIHIPSVESKIVQNTKGSIAVVALNQFGDDAIPEITKAIGALPKDIKGFVLDLRFNGGGYLEGAVDLVSIFQKTGRVVSVERRDQPSEVHNVTGKTLLPDLPMVVLINGGSASASEITAGALKDNDRAKIIGMQSFGKGTVQEIIDLPGGSSLRVTTAKWLTPSGHDLAKKGITPDIVIDRTPDDVRAEKDPQLDAAITWLLDHKDVTEEQKAATGSVQ